MAGLVCPVCGHQTVWNHQSRPDVWFCSRCRWTSDATPHLRNPVHEELLRRGPQRPSSSKTSPRHEVKTMLAQLRNFTVDRLDMDDMIALAAFGKSLRSEYQNREIAVPTWITDALSTLDREILVRRRDELEKRRREINAQLATTETLAEKRERLTREKEELEKQLSVQA